MTDDKIIAKAVVSAAVVGSASSKMSRIDAPAMAIVLGEAIFELSSLHKQDVDLETAGQFALSLMTSLVTYMTRAMFFILLLYLFPLLGLVANRGINAAIDALIALRVCRFANERLMDNSFSKADTKECIYRILMLPSPSELKDLSDILTGQN